jgi:hypothetical protein
MEASTSKLGRSSEEADSQSSAPAWFSAFEQKFEQKLDIAVAKIDKLSADVSKVMQENAELKAELARQQLQIKTLMEELALCKATLNNSGAQLFQLAVDRDFQARMAKAHVRYLFPGTNGELPVQDNITEVANMLKVPATAIKSVSKYATKLSNKTRIQIDFQTAEEARKAWQNIKDNPLPGGATMRQVNTPITITLGILRGKLQELADQLPAEHQLHGLQFFTRTGRICAKLPNSDDRGAVYPAYEHLPSGSLNADAVIDTFVSLDIPTIARLAAVVLKVPLGATPNTTPSASEDFSFSPVRQASADIPDTFFHRNSFSELNNISADYMSDDNYHNSASAYGSNKRGLEATTTGHTPNAKEQKTGTVTTKIKPKPGSQPESKTRPSRKK